jgi:hypothetical protein
MKLNFHKKVTLKQLQSLCGSLAFCTRALPAGRAPNSRLYLATGKPKKPLHLIKVTKEIYEDLLMWNNLMTINLYSMIGFQIVI